MAACGGNIPYASFRYAAMAVARFCLPIAQSEKPHIPDVSHALMKINAETGEYGEILGAVVLSTMALLTPETGIHSHKSFSIFDHLLSATMTKSTVPDGLSRLLPSIFWWAIHWIVRRL
jgi:hypothetical protein